jgi:lysozyme family protein
MPNDQKKPEVADKKGKESQPEKTLFEVAQSFLKEAKNMTMKERMKKITEIILLALAGKHLSKAAAERLAKNIEKKAKEAETRQEFTQSEEDQCLIDPNLVGDIPADAQAVCRRVGKIEEITKDHRHNAKLLEILPGKKKELDTVLAQYTANKARYDKVAQATGIPGMLICAIHYREGFSYNRYLHNGEPLGRPTTYVPAGILFKENEWEQAAIHALGGNVTDNNGRKSLNVFQDLRNQLGLGADSKDIGAMMAFSERYNGMGYRGKGIRSCYVYAGTNLNQPGRYVADHKFDAKSVDQRLGTAAIIMGIQSMESGQPLRIAGQKTAQTTKPA